MENSYRCESNIVAFLQSITNSTHPNTSLTTRPDTGDELAGGGDGVGVSWDTIITYSPTVTGSEGVDTGPVYICPLAAAKVTEILNWYCCPVISPPTTPEEAVLGNIDICVLLCKLPPPSLTRHMYGQQD